MVMQRPHVDTTKTTGKSQLANSNATVGPSTDLRTDFLKSRLAHLPHLPAFAPGSAQAASAATSLKNAEQREGSGLHSVVNQDQSSADSLGPARGGRAKASMRNHLLVPPDYTPISPADCFESALEVDVEYPTLDGSAASATFRVYYTPPQPKDKGKTAVAKPKSLFRSPLNNHGLDADLAALKPELQRDEDEEEAKEVGSFPAVPNSPGTVFVFHHGAGFGALSFALTARDITRATNGEVGVLAFDARGHGRTQHAAHLLPAPTDLSLETLSDDLIRLLATMFPSDSARPSLMLVGHSMGGSVVSSVCAKLLSPNSPFGPMSIGGLAILDVVEGTAMSALPGMSAIVAGRPKGFKTVEDAIEWHLETGEIRNEQSARRSVPALIVPRDSGGEGSYHSASRQSDHSSALSTGLASLGEEEEEDEAQEHMETMDDVDTPTDAFATPTIASAKGSLWKVPALVWRADLASTELYWRGWFEGLSARFLSAKTARLLLLAGTDRLDRELMIGQMQGKYQLTVFPEAGHSLHEDQPERTAKTLIDFWRRNERAPLLGIKKVGEK